MPFYEADGLTPARRPTVAGWRPSGMPVSQGDRLISRAPHPLEAVSNALEVDILRSSFGGKSRLGSCKQSIDACQLLPQFVRIRPGLYSGPKFSECLFDLSHQTAIACRKKGLYRLEPIEIGRQGKLPVSVAFLAIESDTYHFPKKSPCRGRFG